MRDVCAVSVVSTHVLVLNTSDSKFYVKRIALYSKIDGLIIAKMHRVWVCYGRVVFI